MTIEARQIVVDMKAAARERTQEAIDALAAVMNDPKSPPAARVSAATALLARGHGRPHQSADLTQDVAMDVKTSRTLVIPPDATIADLEVMKRFLEATVAAEGIDDC
jgi:hypothetical protein